MMNFETDETKESVENTEQEVVNNNEQTDSNELPEGQTPEGDKIAKAVQAERERVKKQFEKERKLAELLQSKSGKDLDKVLEDVEKFKPVNQQGSQSTHPNAQGNDEISAIKSELKDMKFDKEFEKLSGNPTYKGITEKKDEIKALVNKADMSVEQATYAVMGKEIALNISQLGGNSQQDNLQGVRNKMNTNTQAPNTNPVRQHSPNTDNSSDMALLQEIQNSTNGKKQVDLNYLKAMKQVKNIDQYREAIKQLKKQE